MKKTYFLIWLSATLVFTGCTEEIPPRTAEEFFEDPILLEATMVRCAQDRERTRYDAECINARQAVSMIEASEERERQRAFDAQSDRKRQALRRTQRAAAEARRRARESQRLREEAEYLAQFGELPTAVEDGGAEQSSNEAGAQVPPRDANANDEQTTREPSTPPAIEGGNAPIAETESGAPADLDAVRDELRRRNEQTAE